MTTTVEFFGKPRDTRCRWRDEARGDTVARKAHRVESIRSRQTTFEHRARGLGVYYPRNPAAINCETRHRVKVFHCPCETRLRRRFLLRPPILRDTLRSNDAPRSRGRRRERKEARASHGNDASRKWALSTHLDRIMEAKVYAHLADVSFAPESRSRIFSTPLPLSADQTAPTIRPALPHNATLAALLRLRAIHRSPASSLTTCRLN